MLTNDKSITTPEYWRSVYEGKRNNSKVDASNNKRPAHAFDRFQWLAEQVEGPYVLDIASGHAVTCKRIKAMHPDWVVVATDQTEAARQRADYKPYFMLDAYDLANFYSKYGKPVTTITVSQALEYFEFPDKFMIEVKKIARYFVCTVPEGEMQLWSQLRIYQEESFKDWLRQYGNILFFDKRPGLMLAKIEL